MKKRGASSNHILRIPLDAQWFSQQQGVSRRQLAEHTALECEAIGSRGSGSRRVLTATRGDAWSLLRCNRDRPADPAQLKLTPARLSIVSGADLHAEAINQHSGDVLGRRNLRRVCPCVVISHTAMGFGG